MERPKRISKPSLKVRELMNGLASAGIGRGTLGRSQTATPSKPGSSIPVQAPSDQTNSAVVIASPGIPQSSSSPKVTTPTGGTTPNLQLGRAKASVNSSVSDTMGSAFDFKEMVHEIAKTLRQPQLPVVEPEVFFGDLMSYPRWELQVDEFISQVDASQYAKLQMINRYIGGKAQDCIKELLSVPSSVVTLFTYR